MTEPALTGVEFRVLCLIAEGLSDSAIRHALDLSAATLRHCCHLLYIRTGCRNWQQLTRYAVAHRYVSGDWAGQHDQPRTRTLSRLAGADPAWGAPTTTIVLLDKRPLMRAGLRTVLALPPARVVGEASDEETGLSLCRALLPHVVVVGILHTDLVRAVARIKEACPDTTTIVIAQRVYRALWGRGTPADAYLTEAAEAGDLVDLVLRGGR